VRLTKIIETNRWIEIKHSTAQTICTLKLTETRKLKNQEESEQKFRTLTETNKMNESKANMNRTLLDMKT
jgi:hypothetical protein